MKNYLLDNGGCVQSPASNKSKTNVDTILKFIKISRIKIKIIIITKMYMQYALIYYFIAFFYKFSYINVNKSVSITSYRYVWFILNLFAYYISNSYDCII